MKLYDIIRMANSNLWRNKSRTLLTVLAVFIGAFTIMMTTVDEKPDKASSGVSMPSTIMAVRAHRATMSERTLPMMNMATVMASMMIVAVIWQCPFCWWLSIADEL